MHGITRVCRRAYEREGWSPIGAIVVVLNLLLVAGLFPLALPGSDDLVGGFVSTYWMLAVLGGAYVAWVALGARWRVEFAGAGLLFAAALGVACWFLGDVMVLGLARGGGAPPGASLSEVWPGEALPVLALVTHWGGAVAFGVSMLLFGWRCARALRGRP